MTSTNDTSDKPAAETAGSGGEDVLTGTPGLLAAILSRIGLRSPTLRETLEMGLKGDPEADAAFSAEEREMLRRLLRFGTLRVEDIMVPRADIIALEESEPLSELVRMFSEAGVSRIPLFNETLDDPRGMIHIKDLFRWLTAEAAGRPPAEPRKRGEARSESHDSERAKNEVSLTLPEVGRLDLSRPTTARFRPAR